MYSFSIHIVQWTFIIHCANILLIDLI